MDASDLIALAASSWAVVMALSPLLQMRAMHRAQSAAGVSVGYFVVLLIGFLLWVAYGVSIDNLVLVVPDSLAAAIAVATITMALTYRRS